MASLFYFINETLLLFLKNIGTKGMPNAPSWTTASALQLGPGGPKVVCMLISEQSRYMQGRLPPPTKSALYTE
jgi:hypothetical protein